MKFIIGDIVTTNHSESLSGVKLIVSNVQYDKFSNSGIRVCVEDPNVELYDYERNLLTSEGLDSSWFTLVNKNIIRMSAIEEVEGMLDVISKHLEIQDFDSARETESELYAIAMRYIANGHPKAKELARMVLKSKHLEFSRA